MYAYELPKGYPAWLAKKIEPSVNQLLNKASDVRSPKCQRVDGDGSQSEYGRTPYVHKREPNAYPCIWGVNDGKFKEKTKVEGLFSNELDDDNNRQKQPM